MGVLLFASFLFSIFIAPCPAPGIDRAAEEKIDKIYGDIDGLDPKKAQNKEFFRYILRVVKALEHDEAFKKRSEYLDRDSMKVGKLTNDLYKELSVETRATLDRLKVAEVKFQEDLLAADKTHMLTRENNEWNPIHQTEKGFSQKDLDLLLGRYKSLMNIKDAKRREKFNNHEMEKELKHRETLANAETEEKKKALEEHERKRHEKKHDRMNQPLSNKQLREIWSKEDGLDPEYFDLKTLFKLHDKDDDGHLDEYELDTMFLADLDKAYNMDDPELDVEEREEEMNRMREIAMNMVDTDSDGRVSMEEMIAAKKKQNKGRKKVEQEEDEGEDEDEEYKPLYEGGKEFTEEELSEFKHELEKGKEGEGAI